VDLAGGHTLAFRAGREGGATMAEQEIGRVSHYFGHINVAAIEITQQTLSVGDTIHIKGHTSDFTQRIDSMQLDGKSVQRASVGQSIGVKVAEHAREHDTVYKVTQE
jgi:putative protease